MTTPTWTRRTCLKTLPAAALAAMAATSSSAAWPTYTPKGRIRQGICGGALRKVPFADRIEICKSLGIIGMDFIGPDQVAQLNEQGLQCNILPGSHPLAKGLNDPRNHAAFVPGIRERIEQAASLGVKNVITFSGNRNGISDEEGLAHCVTALKQIMPLAEERGINVCMELLNSKVNHKDYQCDHTAWGVEMCKQVGSPRCKLLYDIYHMQIMEGDIIRTLRDNIAYIAHIHTAGNPGRNEPDETQEIYYPAVMRALAELPYDGVVSHEYGPKKDPVTSLAKVVKLCDV